MSAMSSNHWARVNLDSQTEHEAALATVDFLKKIRDVLKDASFTKDEPALTVSFSSFNPEHLDFILATVGSGEVRATVGEHIRLEECAIEGLWRIQQRGVDRFEVTKVPAVLLECLSTKMLETSSSAETVEGLFAAQAILQELSAQQKTENLDVLSSEPPYTVEISRQPLTPADGTYIEKQLGKGLIDISISGFASAHIQSTAMKGIWRNRIFNNAGKALFDAYVITKLPPEVGESPEEMRSGANRCEEILKWLEDDLQRGSL